MVSQSLMGTESEEERQKRLSDLLSFVQKRVATTQQQTTPPTTPTPEVPNVKGAANGSPTKRPTPTPRVVPKAALADYQFQSNTDPLPKLDIQLRPNVEIRPYQGEALDTIVDPTGSTAVPVARSGIIVLPCGAGKTLTSILVACALKKPVLVVCSTIIAAEQFHKEFLRFTTLMASKAGMFAGSRKWPFNGPSGVLFTTYTMLVENRNRTADSKRMSQFIDKTEWGLVILDEVHCVPANNYSKAIRKINTKVRLGLTATMLREDEKIGDLETMVGPTLYHAKWKELADRGYIAKVICTQVELDLTATVQKPYDELQTNGQGSMLGHVQHTKSLLAILNPKKMQICQRLVQYHEAKGDKVLVYCDHIDALKLYAEKLDRPYIYGGTSAEDARELLGRFLIDVTEARAGASWSEVASRRAQKAKQINTLLLSRIGDTSLDLPAATVLIQVSSHFGSRRQEAQRLGRILRAKKRNEKGFYSRFYTLVSTGTHEMGFSEKRRQFLEEDCGYGYQIWQVGEEDTEGGGWHATENRDAGMPNDDEVRLNPITCSIEGADAKPFSTQEEELKLVEFLRNLKNVQVEEDDTEDAALALTAGTKRKRA